MREILFRGKAINREIGYFRTSYKNGDWVYGLVSKLYDERFENLPAEMTNTYGVSGIDVDYKTIGQYTGLTDKNGEMIFEGDILIYSVIIMHTVVHEQNVKITFKKGSFCMEEMNGVSHPLFHNTENTRLEIIGNIHDNPELLKGDE